MMSLCRFSSDDWRSDVYIYMNSSDDYIIHVAEKRHEPYKPLPPEINIDDLKSEDVNRAFAQRFMEAYKIIKNSPLVAIGGKFDGEEFICKTADETINKLKEIQKEGYHVPEFVFKLLKLSE